MNPSEYDFSIIPPKGWNILYPEPNSKPSAPIITFLGPKKKLLSGSSDESQPFIYINAAKLGDRTFQEHLDEQQKFYKRF